MFRRTRNCCCMNNNMDTDCNNTENILEDTCNNVISYSNDDMYDSCNCGFDEETNLFPENPMLAQSYVPIQYMDKTFKPSVGLKMGTIFPELVLIFLGNLWKKLILLKKQMKLERGAINVVR